jgi:Zn-dependent protease with chaperone function
MRFIARTPREGINISDEHPLVDAFTLTAGLAGLLVLATLLIVLLIDLIVFFISPRIESELFSDWNYAELLPISLDDERISALQAVGDRLAVHWDNAGYDLKLGVLKQGQANAIALPGGTILLTAALLDGMESENELAFVIAHEIGHFQHRDHIRRFGRGFAVGLVLTAVVGRDGGLLNAGLLDVAARSFGRQQESDADSFALELVYAEYGHVADATRFFERMASRQSRFESLSGCLHTHPPPGDRIDALRRLAIERGWSATGEISPLNLGSAER